MTDVFLHVEPRQGWCTAATTKLKTLYVLTVYDNIAAVRMYRMVSLTGAMNKDLLWWLESPQIIL